MNEDIHPIEKNLAQAGWQLPAAPMPIGAYLPAVRSGNWLLISGQLPMRDGKLLIAGKLGAGVEIAQGQQAAAQCAVNALAIARAALDGDWSRLVRAVRLAVFVQCANDFYDQPKVANGASELLVLALGEAGRHARVAVGVNALPLNAAVEIELTFEVR